MPGRSVYRAASRNGINSLAYGPWTASFRFAGVTPPDPNLCPETISEREDQKDGPLACICPAEQTLRGRVWGSGPYTNDSSLCPAAVHAGVITQTGGRIIALPAPSEASYSGSLRNGIRSDNWNDPWDASIRFEGAQQPPATTPVQSPVAHTLRTLGQVALYIQFRTNSAELDAPSIPILRDLQQFLSTDPALKILIQGHTDNTGNATNNRALSQRRAEAVRTWLSSQNIDASRLKAEGKGQDQPLADNITEAGRALNRRVQIIRQ